MTATLTLAAGAPGARILGLGEYRPHRVVTNDELAQTVDTNDAWIRARVGIAERRRAAEGETLLDLAVAAGGKALAASGLGPEDIDLALLATCTPPTPIPSIAPEMAYRLGIHRPGAFDVNAACAGFCYSLAAAADAIRAGSARHVLVVGAEKFTDWIDPLDRGTSIIFGDGAGAAVVGPSDVAEIGPVVWGSDGDKSQAIAIPDRTEMLGMDGQAVYRWATTQLAPVALRACTLAGLTTADIDVFVPHQANLRIVESMAKAIGVGHAAIARDIVESGNTSAASIPLALTRMLETGEAKPGDAALLFGYGAGLTYAGQVVICP